MYIGIQYKNVHPVRLQIEMYKAIASRQEDRHIPHYRLLEKIGILLNSKKNNQNNLHITAKKKRRIEFLHLIVKNRCLNI